VRRRITVADLPKPYQSRSVTNHPRIVKRPKDSGASPTAGNRVPGGGQVCTIHYDSGRACAARTFWARR
jgi:hypothetical protein